MDWGTRCNCTAAKSHSVPLGGCSKGFLTNLREFPATLRFTGIHYWALKRLDIIWIQTSQTANMGICTKKCRDMGMG